MRKRQVSRRLIGLAAAYLVALQAFILPLSLPTAAAGALCLSLADHSAPAPAGGDHGCPCAAGCGMQCHATALSPGATASLPAPRPRVAAVLAPLPRTQSSGLSTRGPHMPRGPPAA
jgi:hypothetical protein